MPPYYAVSVYIINLTPFKPKAMRDSYKSLKTKENLTTAIVG